MNDASSVDSENHQAVYSDRARWLALFALCTGMLMIVLDATVVNVALPTIKRELHFSQSTLAWVINGYLISFGGLLLLSGRTGDLVGRKRIFLIGLGIFTLASALCGFAQSQTVLISARFVQGIGGALTSSVILGMIVTMFPERSEQAKAIGVFSFVAAAGGSVGLLLGGVITQAINWHWIFFVNVPIGIATGAVAWRLVNNDKGIGWREGADILGALLVTGALMLAVYTIVKPAATKGWGSGETLGLLAGSLVLLALFIVREATARKPLMPLRIFRSRNVAGTNIIQAFAVAGLYGTFFLGSLYFQNILHFDPLEIGLAFLPVTILIGVLSLQFSARLTLAFGAKATLLPALVLTAGGLALFARVPVHANYAIDLLPGLILIGIGAGLSFPALASLAMSSATPRDAGLASGLINTSIQVGGALGLAVLATISASHTKHELATGRPSAIALTSGYHLAWIIGVGLVLFAVVIGSIVLQKQSWSQAGELGGHH